MDRMRRIWSGINRKLQSGQSMTEYALILALVVVVGLATWASLGGKITSTISGVIACL
jgi:Flp pilus assembly pilin Flp